MKTRPKNSRKLSKSATARWKYHSCGHAAALTSSGNPSLTYHQTPTWQQHKPVSLAVHSKSISTLEGECWKGKLSLYFLAWPPCQPCIQCRKKTARVGDFRLPSQHVQLANVTQVWAAWALVKIITKQLLRELRQMKQKTRQGTSSSSQ